MKTLLTLTNLFALVTALPLAQAQTPTTAHNKPASTKSATNADQRAATYQGPKVVKDTKKLGQKMVQKSKPTDMRVPVPVQIK